MRTTALENLGCQQAPVIGEHNREAGATGVKPAGCSREYGRLASRLRKRTVTASHLKKNSCAADDVLALDPGRPRSLHHTSRPSSKD